MKFNGSYTVPNNHCCAKDFTLNTGSTMFKMILGSQGVGWALHSHLLPLPVSHMSRSTEIGQAIRLKECEAT